MLRWTSLIPLELSASVKPLSPVCRSPVSAVKNLPLRLNQLVPLGAAEPPFLTTPDEPDISLTLSLISGTHSCTPPSNTLRITCLIRLFCGPFGPPRARQSIRTSTNFFFLFLVTTKIGAPGLDLSALSSFSASSLSDSFRFGVMYVSHSLCSPAAVFFSRLRLVPRLTAPPERPTDHSVSLSFLFHAGTCPAPLRFCSFAATFFTDRRRAILLTLFT